VALAGNRWQRCDGNDERAEGVDEAPRLRGRNEPLKGNPVRGSGVKQTHEAGDKKTVEDVGNVEDGRRWTWKSIACLAPVDVAKRDTSHRNPKEGARRREHDGRKRTGGLCRGVKLTRG